MRALLASVFLIAGLASSIRPASAEDFITIGTGSVTGVYYPTGGAICRLVNEDASGHGVRCSVTETDGSIYNLKALHAGELDMAIVQSDWQYHAVHGTARFKDAEPFESLRAVFSIHPEPFTVVARKDAPIRRFEDLKGMRVNIGNPGSGQRATMELLMQAHGWSRDDFLLAAELPPSEQGRALCDNTVDAVVYVAGHPSGSILEATTECAARLVEVNNEVVDKLIAEHDYYRQVTIPGGLYPGNSDEVETFGVVATLVSSTRTPDEVVYQLVKSVFEDFDTFTRLHPVFENLKADDMIGDGLSAPLHDGALQYYRQAGLL